MTEATAEISDANIDSITAAGENTANGTGEVVTPQIMTEQEEELVTGLSSTNADISNVSLGIGYNDEAAHERLYKLALKNQLTMTSTPDSKRFLTEKQDECTFSPNLVAKNSLYHQHQHIGSDGVGTPVHERLYNPNYLQQRDEKLRELREEKELKGCTFSPQLVSSPRSRQCFEYKDNVYERLYELARVKQQQQQQCSSAISTLTPTRSANLDENTASNSARKVKQSSNLKTKTTTMTTLQDFHYDDNDDFDFDPAKYSAAQHNIDDLIQQVLQGDSNDPNGGHCSRSDSVAKDIMPAPQDIVRTIHVVDNDDEVDVSFLSDEQDFEQMVRDAQEEMDQLSNENGALERETERTSYEKGMEVSSQPLFNDDDLDEQQHVSSDNEVSATPAPMEKELLNGSLGSFEALDDEVDIGDENHDKEVNIGDAMENINIVSSVEEEHLLTARRGVEKFDGGDSSSRRSSFASCKSAYAVAAAIEEKEAMESMQQESSLSASSVADVLTTEERNIIQDLATMKIDDSIVDVVVEGANEAVLSAEATVTDDVEVNSSSASLL